MSLFASAEGRRAGRLLDYAQVLREVAGWGATARGRELLRAIEPTADPEQLAALWQHVEEWTRLLEDGDDLPVGDMIDLGAVLGERRTHAGPLDPSTLAELGAACFVLSQVLKAAQSRRERMPKTATLLEGAHSPHPLAEQLAAALESDGRVKDGASPKLAGLRRAIAAAAARVRETARREMGRAAQHGWTSASELALRGDHYCIPVLSRHRRSVTGVMHDRSDTGGTVFIEPIAVVEASNLLQQAKLAATEEERRIVAALNHSVSARAPEVLDLYDRVIQLDLVRARAVWGRKSHGRLPELHPKGSGVLSLTGFRHPLLRAQLAVAGRERELVELDLSLRATDRVLLISGPNAGGKTVTMKSVGLAVLLAQSGLPLPARGAVRLSIFERVLMDLGDEQSIADALSSFSAHITHLRGILELADAHSLVLLDEVGGGTDPLEGVALARAVLEELNARGCTTLATTHYGQLKAMADAADGFRSASMEFDAEKLRPRFRLVLDVPGSSHALAIAQRLGLADSVVQRARSLVGDDALRLDALLREAERQRVELTQAREEAQTERQRALKIRQQYETMAHELRRTRRQRLDDVQRQAEGIVRGARARIERLLAEVLQAAPAQTGPDPSAQPAADPREVAAKARSEVDALAAQLHRELEGRASRARGRPARLEPGAWVRHARLGVAGRIVEVRDGNVLLEVSGRRVVAGPEDLLAPDTPATPPGDAAPPEGVVRSQIDLPATEQLLQLDVRGLTTEEAWEQVDRAVDRCLLAGVAQLEIVHGKGTGALRRALHDRLRGDRRISSAKLGAFGTDDDGVTIVQL